MLNREDVVNVDFELKDGYQKRDVIDRLCYYDGHTAMGSVIPETIIPDGLRLNFKCNLGDQGGEESHFNVEMQFKDAPDNKVSCKITDACTVFDGNVDRGWDTHNHHIHKFISDVSDLFAKENSVKVSLNDGKLFDFDKAREYKNFMATLKQNQKNIVKKLVDLTPDENKNSKKNIKQM